MKRAVASAVVPQHLGGGTVRVRLHGSVSHGLLASRALLVLLLPFVEPPRSRTRTQLGSMRTTTVRRALLCADGTAAGTAAGDGWWREQLHARVC